LLLARIATRHQCAKPNGYKWPKQEEKQAVIFGRGHLNFCGPGVIGKIDHGNLLPDDKGGVIGEMLPMIKRLTLNEIFHLNDFASNLFLDSRDGARSDLRINRDDDALNGNTIAPVMIGLNFGEDEEKTNGKEAQKGKNAAA